jgi:hypothetical protein
MEVSKMAVPAPSMVEMDFAVMAEDYSRYLLQDGTTLKVKIVVRKIFRTAEITPQGYPASLSIDSVNAVAAIVPPSLKGAPSKERFDPTKDVGEEIKFDPIEEKWQTYMTPEGYKILVKPVLTKVIKYKKYNQYGEPIYSAVIQAITNIEKITSTATP